mgnify:CR=1 FL=1
MLNTTRKYGGGVDQSGVNYVSRKLTRQGEKLRAK